jgi:glyoxylase-like metal-dependent hydrolase (beta-lactamase superfamily II)
MLNVDLFPNAIFLIHPAEREYLRRPHVNDWATPHYASMVLESYRLQEVSEGDEIGPGLRVLDAPGHTRGSMALLVDTNEGVAAVCGDALPSAWSVRSGLPRLIFWDEEQARVSVAKLLASAERFYPGHDRPFRVSEGKVEYLEPTSVSVTNIPDLDSDEGPPFSYRLVSPREAQIYLPE